MNPNSRHRACVALRRAGAVSMLALWLAVLAATSSSAPPSGATKKTEPAGGSALAAVPATQGPQQNRPGSSGRGLHGHVFALDSAGDITGVVAGAKIEFKNQAGQAVAQVTAGQNGYYQADLTPGVYYYKVTAPGFKDEDVKRGIHCQLMEGYAVQDFWLSAGENDPEKKPAEIIPVEIGALKGMVLEKKPSGQLVAIPAATLTLQNDQPEPQTATVVASPPDRGGKGAGAYRVTLEVGSWQASVTAEGFDPFFDADPIRIVSGREETRHFILSRPEPKPAPEGQGIKGLISVRGTGVTPVGPDRPTPSLSQVKVSMIPLRPAGESIEPVSPDARGDYGCNLPVGSYQVTAELPGYKTARSRPRTVFLGRFTVVDLTLVPAAEPKETAPGVLVLLAEVYEHTADDVTGKRPLDGATVLVRTPGQDLSQAKRAVSNAEGKVRLKVLSEGTYDALARKDGYRMARATVRISSGGENRAELILEKEAESMPPSQPPQQELVVRALVYERTSDDVTSKRPLTGAEVIIRGGEELFGEPVLGVTGMNGEARIAVPRPGEYQAVARLRGYEPFAVTVAVQPRGANLAEIPLRRIGQEPGPMPPTTPPGQEPSVPGQQKVGVEVEVVAYDQTRQLKALPGAHVMVFQQDREILRQDTDARGRCTFQLSLNNYMIAAVKEGYEPREELVPLLEAARREEREGGRPAGATAAPRKYQLVLSRRAMAEEQPEPGPMPPATPPGHEPSVPGQQKVGVEVEVVAYDQTRQLKALPGAHVMVFQQDREILRQDTDARGRCTFQLSLNNYMIAAVKEGYEPREELVPLLEAARREEREGGRPAGATAAPRKYQLVLSRRAMAEEQPEPGPMPPATPPGHEPVTPGPGGLSDRPRLPLSIQVVDSRGARVGGADVSIHWGEEGRDRIVATPTKSNAAGIASFQLPRQEYWASARSGGVEGRAPVPGNWDPRHPIIVRLPMPGQRPGTPQPPKEESRPATPEKPTPLRIQVVDSRGVRMGGADVTIHWGPEGRDRIVAGPSKSTSGGIAEFQVPRQSYWVSARSGGVEGRGGVPSNWDPRRPIVVRLDLPGQGPGTPQPPKEESRPATLTVVVKSAQGNQPLGAAEVRVFGSQGGPRVGRTDGGGRYHVALPPGDYRIQASKAGYHPGSDGLRIGRNDVERTILLRVAIE